MNTLWKNNKPMTATIISGILILIGIYFQFSKTDFPVAIIFVSSFIIGGFFQAREGFYDTIENKRLNVDILMVLAAIGASIIGYWLEGALLIFIFSLSGSLEEYALNKSTEAISSLMSIVPATAKRLTKENQLETVNVEDLSIGDRIFVAKGDSLPIDGTLLSKKATINESSITGESIPREKKENDQLYATSINLDEPIMITVNKNSNETLFAKIIQMVKEAQSTPSKTASFITNIENKYVTAVLIFVPAMIFIFYFFLNWTWSESFYRGMVLLTVASPCALVASATPATLAAISSAAKKGILFKGGIAIENFSSLSCIAFDKTGTLTNGKPIVTDSYISPEQNERDILGIVYALEYGSTHPIAIALVNFLKERNYSDISLTNQKDLTGLGLSGEYQGDEWRIGKMDFTRKHSKQTNIFSKQTQKLSQEGKTVVSLSKNGEMVAYFALLDIAKTGAKETISFLQKNDIHTLMITGDNHETAKAIADELGIDEYRANCLPEQKTGILKDLQKEYDFVGMVGDGINDAPALANADIGVAMGQGTDIAMQTADVVLIQNDLETLEYSYHLSKKLKKITVQNIVFSMSVIILLIIANLMQVINLPIGVIGHEGSTILVILNGLRLLLNNPKN